MLLLKEILIFILYIVNKDIGVNLMKKIRKHWWKLLLDLVTPWYAIQSLKSKYNVIYYYIDTYHVLLINLIIKISIIRFTNFSALTAVPFYSNKRGLDLGLSRGFSGSQAAKHLMGLAAANYAGGPGRRRRSEQA